ncbi:MAG: nucleotidyltransferase family protein, partial [Chitinophagaceae bacterium]
TGRMSFMPVRRQWKKQTQGPDKNELMSDKSYGNHIGIILLAGGESSRLGRPKQLLEYHGQTLLQYSLQVALNADAQPVIAVLGSDADKMQKEINDTRVQVEVNSEWQEGMASSIRCGIKAVAATSPTAEGVIIMVCDQPFVTTQLLNKLITAHQETGKPIVASGYENTFGPPVFFHHSVFTELLQLKGDIGARSIIKQHADEVEVVPFPDGAYDIDTEADYETVKRNSE